MTPASGFNKAQGSSLQCCRAAITHHVCCHHDTQLHTLHCCCCYRPPLLLLLVQELAGELGAHLAATQASVESALRVVYLPQAVFRVRPVARCTASLPGHSESVLAVAFSPDGRRLASGSGDTTLRFWDLETQLPKAECKVWSCAARCVCVCMCV
jgi:WD domain, G-beta repeat